MPAVECHLPNISADLQRRDRIAAAMLLSGGPESVRASSRTSPDLGARQHDRRPGRSICSGSGDSRRAAAERDPAGDHRAPGGAIPNNVDCATLHPNFRAYADGGLWWVIGSALLAPDPDAVREVLRWYEYQDVDQSGLLSMQESSDWQDLFCTRGKGLYLNCLYVLALRSAAKLFDGDEAERLSHPRGFGIGSDQYLFLVRRRWRPSAVRYR